MFPMKKTTLLLSFLLLFTAQAFAQQPDRWRGLIIDETTPEQAIEILGEPESDRARNGRIFINNPKWLRDGAAKELRVLHWENVGEFPDVKLGFENDTLVLIHLEPKKLTAQAFVSAYDGLELRYGNEVQSPSDFERERVNSDRPFRLGVVYLLVGVTDKVFVFGQCGNATGNVMSTLFGGGDDRQAGRSVPGDVGVIQLVSRTLEDRTAVDLLK